MTEIMAIGTGLIVTALGVAIAGSHLKALDECSAEPWDVVSDDKEHLEAAEGELRPVPFDSA
ncbi:MAG TPA: hypothetical protein VEZ90_16630 [Blastocatellia bacterium]|nr:hypothetical protein [Blastocatellia bacterium]